MLKIPALLAEVQTPPPAPEKEAEKPQQLSMF
jgi:hypothetical protein